MAGHQKRVLLAAPRGYCAGVDRAVRVVELALEKYGPPVFVRKQIVHNGHVVRALAARGAVFVEDIDEVSPGSVIIFSAHGVAPAVVDQARARDLRVVDATCPLVTKVHAEARRFGRTGHEILLIGHREHDEVIGTVGESQANTQVVGSALEASKVEVRDPEKVAWLAQTTLSVDETDLVVGALRERFPAIVGPPSDDICYATQNRQSAVKAVARHADVVLVVGSANSSNSQRLLDVAHDSGVPAAHLVEDASQVDVAWLATVTTVGLTSGASTPEPLVTGVLELLAEYGFGDVQEVVVTTEDVSFSLPNQLSRNSPGATRAVVTDTARQPNIHD